MDRVAFLSSSERYELFQEASAILGISPAIAEKDFWVCWILKSIFTNQKLKPHLVFKGGTSLSKVYKIIERFSEDVDLILDWSLLGYGKGEDPYQDHPSRTKQDSFNTEFNRRAADYIKSTLGPQLDKLMSHCPGVKITVEPKESQVVTIQYPGAFSEEYLHPEVRLEIGPLASFVPRGEFIIKPYAAEALPWVFDKPECPVIATKIERTFWEKATILHQQAHRAGPMPPRYSRHYYDMYKLATSEFKTHALNDLSLLKDVVQFKARFYRCSWARYEDAKPGTLRLVPKEEYIDALRKDYRQMKVMIFDEAPEFDQILRTLAQLENEINRLSYDGPEELKND